MKIVVVSEWFSDGMGYAENFLPKAFGRAGHEVHLLTSDFQVYATSPDYDRIYRKKLGDKQVGRGVFAGENFTGHRLPGRAGRFGIQIPELFDALVRLKPDLVYCFEISCPSTVQAARSRKVLGYRLFCESRWHASIFRPPVGWIAKFKWGMKKRIIGIPDVIDAVDRFYPLGPDVLSIITTCLGVPEARCTLSSLGVETNIFSPSGSSASIQAFRNRMGFKSADLVCVYTGRFTPDKGPAILAKAIDVLHARGHRQVRGLFVGQGDERYVAQIANCAGCVTHPFVTPGELAGIYQASDIGVWPLQESTSQLDALACGLPIIINDSVLDAMRLGPGTLTFKKNNVEDLADRIMDLQDRETRQELGGLAAARMLEQCSWDALAHRRVEDFKSLLK